MSKNTLLPKKKDKGIFVIMGFVYIFSLIFSIHIANAMYPASAPKDNNAIGIQAKPVGDDNFVSAFQTAMTSLEEDPFGIFPMSGKTVFFILGITVIFALACIYVSAWKQDHQNDMPGASDGTASWNDDMKSYNEKYTTQYTPAMKKEGLPDPNVLLSKNVKLGMDNNKTRRNLNTIVFGGSGTGKSYGFIKPNLMQMNCSTITTDPSGELLQCTGKALRENGIRVKVFSTSDMEHSNCYNPFDYVYDEKGIIDETKVSTMVFLFLKNANGAKEKSGDPFWEKSAKALISAIAYFLLEGAELGMILKENVNYTQVLKLVQAGKVNEESSSSQSQLDMLMEERKKEAQSRNVISRAYDNYATFKLATGKTANSILITCAVDLQLFSTAAVKNLTRTDFDDDSNNLHLETVGDEQTALFINIPQANATYNFLVSMMYSQLFDALYTRAEKTCPSKWIIYDKYNRPLITMIDSKEKAEGLLTDLKQAEIKEYKNKRGVLLYRIVYGRNIICEKPSKKSAEEVIRMAKEASVKPGKLKLPWHVRCLMDEFANIGEVPQFSEMLATMRKYEISCVIVLQSLAQLKAKYDKLFEGIIGNCDSMVFLGSTESETCKYISDMLGKATIRSRNTSRSMSAKGGNSSQSYQNKGRTLLEINEVSLLNNNYCIVRVRGEEPFYDEKYAFPTHPNYNLSGDCSKDNQLIGEELDLLFNSTPMDKLQKERKAEERRKKRIGKARGSIISLGSSSYSTPNSEKEVFDLVGVDSIDSLADNLETIESSEQNIKNIENEPKTTKERTLKASVTSKAYAQITGPDGGFLF